MRRGRKHSVETYVQVRIKQLQEDIENMKEFINKYKDIMMKEAEKYAKIMLEKLKENIPQITNTVKNFAIKFTDYFNKGPKGIQSGGNKEFIGFIKKKSDYV